MIITFKHSWLENFYEEDKSHKKIPNELEDRLYGKLQLLDAAKMECDLRLPPSNKFEHLKGNLKEYCSIRVNKQYRLIFKWIEGNVEDLYLDKHEYK
ncbi:toxin [Parashewanella spongiae]|uniref:Toxin n=1 Tax=Parashewanella spongiae TaxID=342950 RepID=A0A3A6UP41_9GAMM|nr:type II toxin-antitoxin system RelE/ParE family toxin [Parashewanella spongiae]MCL1076590.1 type II toxin-antitoxin system RelE/ParE family toxin [Parashewanella spongiae]RJY19601.1 toxin [Parashewanella spongiae]